MDAGVYQRAEHNRRCLRWVEEQLFAWEQLEKPPAEFPSFDSGAWSAFRASCIRALLERQAQLKAEFEAL